MTIPFDPLREDATALAEREARAWTCSNCGGTTPKPVLAASRGADRVLILDGAPLSGARGERLLCMDCGVVEAVLEGPNGGPAPGLPQAQRNLDAVPRRRVMEERLLDHMRRRHDPSGSTGRLLDIQCGAGHLTRRFAHSFQTWTVMGIDRDPSLTEDWPPANGRPGFLRDRFDPALFTGHQFDAVVAHGRGLGGWLSGAPPLVELARLRPLCAAGALVSLEMIFLETAPEVAHVWDERFLTSRDRFASWMRVCGFDVLEMHNDVTSWHVIAQAVEVSGPLPGPVALEPGEAERLASGFTAHQTWWQDVLERYRAEAVGEGSDAVLLTEEPFRAPLLALEPAGRVLGRLSLDDPQASCNDEAATGIPVVGPDQIPAIAEKVLMLTWPARAATLADQIKARGVKLPVIDLANMVGGAQA